MGDSTSVVKHLESGTGARVVILGDTSYGRLVHTCTHLVEYLGETHVRLLYH